MIKNILLNKIKTSKKDRDFFEILSGSIWSFGAKILAVLLGLLLNLMITRLYGVESMGIFALINSFFSITIILALVGTNTSILRLVPEYIKKSSNQVAINLYLKHILIVIVTSIVLAIVFYFNAEFISNTIFSEPTLIEVFLIASLLIIFPALYTLNLSAFRAFKEIKLFSLFQVINPLSKVLILLFFTFYSINQFDPVYSLFIAYISLTIISFIFLSNKFKKMNPDNTKSINAENNNITFKSILILSTPMFLTSSMHIIMSQTDIVMLGMMSDIKEIGIYSITLKLAVLTSFILGTVNTMAAPKFSELYYSGQMEALKRVAKKSTKLMFYTTLPIVLIFILFGKYLLSIFGDEFIEGYIALIILVAGQSVNALVGSVGYFMNMTGHQKELNIIVVSSAIVNIILNYILIPLYGIIGAAVATAISLALWNILAAIYIKIKFGFSLNYSFNLRKI